MKRIKEIDLSAFKGRVHTYLSTLRANAVIRLNTMAYKRLYEANSDKLGSDYWSAL